MFSTFETIETSSESETSDEENYESEEMKYIKQTHFLNQTSLEEYEKNRNMLYTKDILRKRLVIDSHNYFQPDGFNIGVNSGETAGQTIFHAHIHLIPRYKNDVSNPRGGIRNVIPGKADY